MSPLVERFIYDVKLPSRTSVTSVKRMEVIFGRFFPREVVEFYINIKMPLHHGSAYSMAGQRLFKRIDRQ